MSKYHNQKTTVGDRVFDSKREADRYVELMIMQNMGVIKGLECQKPYKLIKGKWRTGRPFSITYKADFVYTLDGEIVVEDVKGYRTDVYKIKKKLMKAIYGIEIQEVT